MIQLRRSQELETVGRRLREEEVADRTPMHEHRLALIDRWTNDAVAHEAARANGPYVLRRRLQEIDNKDHRAALDAPGVDLTHADDPTNQITRSAGARAHHAVTSRQRLTDHTARLHPRNNPHH